MPVPSYRARLVGATQRGRIGRFVAADEVDHFVGTKLVELCMEAAAYFRCCFLQLSPAVFFETSAHRRDDDLAAFQAEADLATRRDTCSVANVLRDCEIGMLWRLRLWLGDPPPWDQWPMAVQRPRSMGSTLFSTSWSAEAALLCACGGCCRHCCARGCARAGVYGWEARLEGLSAAGFARASRPEVHRRRGHIHRLGGTSS